MSTNKSRPYVVTDLPKAARPWSDIVTRVYGRITEARVFLVAAGVTFYALLAIFGAGFLGPRRDIDRRVHRVHWRRSQCFIAVIV
jgi:hypothetical protein